MLIEGGQGDGDRKKKGEKAEGGRMSSLRKQIQRGEGIAQECSKLGMSGKFKSKGKVF